MQSYKIRTHSKHLTLVLLDSFPGYYMFEVKSVNIVFSNTN